VPQSNLYKLAQAQLAEAHGQLESRAKQLAALQHDKDELLRHVETKAQQAEVGGGGRGGGLLGARGCLCVITCCVYRVALQHDKDELLWQVETKAQQTEVGGWVGGWGFAEPEGVCV
jgi:hypothetical protein